MLTAEDIKELIKINEQDGVLLRVKLLNTVEDEKGNEIRLLTEELDLHKKALADIISVMRVAFRTSGQTSQELYITYNGWAKKHKKVVHL